MRLTKKEKVSYGLGAVGKDIVYMLSANYILYYYQDIMGVSAFAMGVILMAARIFDAFNDPIMGVVVAKTKTRWGKFRPWLLIGTVMNAIILYLMFMAPPALNGGGLVAYAAVFLCGCRFCPDYDHYHVVRTGSWFYIQRQYFTKRD